MSENQTSFKKFTRWFWVLFATPFLFVLILFFLISKNVFGPLPTFEQLENPNNNLASSVYSEDGMLLGTFYLQNRTYVSYADLPPHLVKALIATEDIRFKKHAGIDFRALGRVIFRTIILGQSGSGGGSTITQQVAKNLYQMREPLNEDKKKSFFEKITNNIAFVKFKEWVTAVRLERNYTKDEIITMYLNTVFYGHNSFGIRSAAKTFFNTSTDSLKLEEAALLVGVVNKPTKFSPKNNPERAKLRRNHVLSQMHKYGFISGEVFDSVSVLPIELSFNIQDHNEGLATYFRAYLQRILRANEPKRKWYFTYEQFLEDSIQWADNPLYGWCNKNRKPDGSPYNIYKDGLRIYSTINSRMQKYAEEAVFEHLSQDLQPTFMRQLENGKRKNSPYSNDLEKEDVENLILISLRRTDRYRSLRNTGVSMDSIMSVFNTPTSMRVFSYEGAIDTVMTPIDSIRYYKHFLRPAFVSMDPHTGHVKAYVGGQNYRYFQFDAVTQGKRQAGSTIKPFLYTLAMQEGYTPCTEIPLIPQTFQLADTVWTPKNSGSSNMEGKDVTLKWGLAKSNNWVSAWVMKQFPPQAVVDLAHKMGIKSYIDPVYSVFLGTADFSLSEVVGAYATYANKGIHSEPIYVTRIEDKNGNILAQFNSFKQEAINENTAYLMLNLMQGVTSLTVGGTGSRLRWKYQFEGEIAAKTGTTQNNSDGWFLGVTPNLVNGAWVGGEDRAIRFESTYFGSGANMALPIWALYMKKVYADSTLSYSEQDKFDRPLNFNINLDCSDEKKEQQHGFDQFDSQEDFF